MKTTPDGASRRAGRGKHFQALVSLRGDEWGNIIFTVFAELLNSFFLYSDIQKIS